MTNTIETKPAGWTVLVYMAGDNNLTEEMAWGLQELKKTAARLEAREGLRDEDRINVVAHFDPRGVRSRRYDFAPSQKALSAAHAAETLASAKSGKRAAEVQEDASKAAGEAALQARLERESGAVADGNLHGYEAVIRTRRSAAAGQALPIANPLSEFVREQVERLPKAERYMLVLSGHGSGAVGDFLNDSDPRTSLSIPELSRILSTARQAYAAKEGSNAPPMIDILGMDSCLMSNAEVCYEIRDDARWLVASEGWVANAGWPYHRVLEACEVPKAEAAAESVAKQVAAQYAAFYRDYEIAGISTDIAVCRLAAFCEEGDRSLVGRLQALSRACIGAFDAVFVQGVVRSAASQASDAEAQVPVLCEQIATLLCEDATAREKLLEQLTGGSDLADKGLQHPPTLAGLNDSQLRAVRELVESLGGAYGQSGKELEDAIGVCWKKLAAALTGGVARWSVALALVKLLRESDPGVLTALRIIERRQRGSAKPSLTQARVLLQKLHQIRCVLELAKLGKKIEEASAAAAAKSAGEKGMGQAHQQGILPDEDLLNAVVAARWQAQSFKSGVYVDLFDFCERLARGPSAHEVKGICAAIGDTAAKAVVASYHTGPDCQHAKGLSVYFPCQTADYEAQYDNLEFAKKTGWGRLVRSYLRATRRERRGEKQGWADVSDHVLRFGHSEVDPLEADGIEARIVGVVSPPPSPAGTAEEPGFAAADAVEERIKAGVEERIRAGVEEWIRAGVEERIKAGVEERIKVEGAARIEAGFENGNRAGVEEHIRAGVEERIRALVEENIKAGVEAKVRAAMDAAIRAGVEERVRAGVEERIRAGVEERIRAGIEERVRDAMDEGMRAAIDQGIKTAMQGEIRAGVEKRIRTGVEERIKAGVEERIRAGVEERIRAGVEERIRAGVEERIRTGTETKIRTGTEAKIRGDGGMFVWGNPPDGFFRQAERDNGK